MTNGYGTTSVSWLLPTGAVGNATGRKGLSLGLW